MKSSILFLSFLLFVIYIVYQYIKAGAFRKKCSAIFESTFADTVYRPRYEFRWSYGFPSFTVEFDSKEELVNAKTQGFVEKLQKELGDLCKDKGTKGRPFNAEQSIWFTYMGELDT